ncbi:ABC transporter ATP-binding protein [Halococcus salifodinae]|uniref:ABC transporter ATP-binding protein n=1 Tax=Halococcus salifodinae DSM 8989 TaxID=1227456 RepID=M0MWS9_9EURY|nr:ABC transporter ATP-binding protein [Halococcus salifodinae]EMA49294.1 ABC transporter ATP-binding protein [Halococcus salifodinae DSM 8989]
MERALVAEDIHRKYGDRVALDGVSLSVDAGEVFALVGPNGAGKTTLVRALTGTTAVDGEVSVFGESPATVAKSRLGVLPQEFTPPERLSARELIAYYAGLYDAPRDVEGVLADVGLADTADTHYENLSGGQRRRTCVGATLVNDPDLLVLDEPTTGIDPAGRRDLRRLLADLADGGTTVLLTTHDMTEAERLADRVGLLADGRLAAVDSPAALVAEHGGENRIVVDLVADPIEDGTTIDDSDGTAPSPATAVDALGETGHRVELRDTELVVHGVDAADIGRVVDDLERTGIVYDGLEWRQPDLEDVYLAVTGQALVSGEEPVAEPTDDDGNDSDDTAAETPAKPNASDGETGVAQ